MKLVKKIDKSYTALGLVAISGAFLFTGCQSTVMENRENVPAAQRELGYQKDAQIIGTSEDNFGYVADTPESIARPNRQSSNVSFDFEPMEELGKEPVYGNGKCGIKTSGSSSNLSVGGSYVVKKGDSLGKIAYLTKTKVADIMAINSIKNPNHIRIGQKIKLPSNAKSGNLNSKSSSYSSNSASTSRNLKGGLYTIVKGDSVSRIAKNFKVKRADLMAANNLNEQSILRIGQKLVIPGHSTVKATTATQSSRPAQVQSQTQSSSSALNNVSSKLDTTEETTTATETETEAPIKESTEVDNSQPVLIQEEISLADFCAKYNVKAEDIKANTMNEIPENEILTVDTLVFLQ